MNDKFKQNEKNNEPSHAIKDINDRLKNLDERYLNPKNTDAYVNICNPDDENDTLISDIKNLIYYDLFFRYILF